MVGETPSQVTRLKRALAELRANQSAFSDDAFAQMLMLMLRRLRELRTLPRDPRSQADDMRLVTVLFVDVTAGDVPARPAHPAAADDTTRDWAQASAQLQERIAAIVEDWGGRVGQSLGDGMVCFFGAQRSQGDDAENAVACALALQASVQQAARTEPQHRGDGAAFQVRIGISTGRVVVGLIDGENKRDLLGLGPAVNLASRLQALAAPGEVLVDAVTHARIRRDFITQAQLPQSISGFDAPVVPYRVLEQRNQTTMQLTQTRLHSIAIPLIGRDDDLAVMNYLFDRSLEAQQSQVITLHGDIGVGKSRLLQEAAHLAESNFVPMVMSAHETQSGTPYSVLRDLLESYCNLGSTETHADIQQQIAAYVQDLHPGSDAATSAQALGWLAGYLPEAPPGDAEEWVLGWLRAVAQAHHLLLVVDNLQWADAQSIALLERAAHSLGDTPSVLLAAGRSEFWTQHPRYMQGHPRHKRILLSPLSPGASRRVLDAVLRYVDDVPHSVVELLLERAEGNPLFIQEYLSMFFEQSIFAPQDGTGRWQYNRILHDMALRLPERLVEILQSRLDDLSPQLRHLVGVASVVGTVFWHSLLEDLLAPEPITAPLEQLIACGILLRHKHSDFPNEVQYSFRHALYRDVAYGLLSNAERKRYHTRVANWMLPRIAGKRSYYALLAEHFCQSDQYEAALHTYLETVQDHIEQEHLHTALQLIDRSLAIANRVNREDALPLVSTLWMHRGQALVELARYDEASAASQSALMLLEELPKTELVSIRTQAERDLGLALVSQGRYNEAYDALSRAHNLLSMQSTEQLSTVLRAFGQLWFYRGRLEDSLAYQKRAASHADKTGHPRHIAAARSQRGRIDLERGRVAAALKGFQETTRLYRELSLSSAEAHDLLHLGRVYLALMQYEQAKAYFDQAAASLASGENLHVLIQAYRGFSLLRMGERIPGRALLTDAYEHGHRDTYTQKLLHLLYAHGLLVQEEYVKAREQSIRFIQLNGHDNALLRARGLRLLGAATHLLGNMKAQDILHEALEIEQFYGGLDVWRCHYCIAQCCGPSLRQEHTRKAAEALQQQADDLAAHPQLKRDFLYSAPIPLIFAEAGLPLPD